MRRQILQGMPIFEGIMPSYLMILISRFIGQSLAAMQHHTAGCDEAIVTKQPSKMVENTSAIARLANRVLQLTKQEADNSEDPKYISVLNISAGQLQTRK